MGLRSMTGFAREAGVTGPHRWAWELRTVNGRGLEMRLRVPPGFDAVGEEARRAVSASLTRGQCQLTLTVARAPGPPAIRINREVLGALASALGEVKVPGLGPATLDGLLAVRGVIEADETDGDDAFDEALKADLAAAAGRLVVAVNLARSAEGAALAATLSRQLDGIERLVDEAESCPARQPTAIRARLAAQVEALVGAAPSLDPARLHQEAALLATRADIREEIDRLRAHVTAARSLLGSGEAVGRRLDFLAQEFGRESNTLCAKANDVALSRIGLELKAAVEQVREQVQNVE